MGLENFAPLLGACMRLEYDIWGLGLWLAKLGGPFFGGFYKGEVGYMTLGLGLGLQNFGVFMMVK